MFLIITIHDFSKITYLSSRIKKINFHFITYALFIISHFYLTCFYFTLYMWTVNIIISYNNIWLINYALMRTKKSPPRITSKLGNFIIIISIARIVYNNLTHLFSIILYVIVNKTYKKRQTSFYNIIIIIL